MRHIRSENIGKAALSIRLTLYDWKGGEGYVLPITHDRKAQIAAVLAERPFLKIVRFVPLPDICLRGAT